MTPYHIAASRFTQPVRHARAAVLAVFVLMLAVVQASAIETAAPRALILESDTGSVLFAKNTDQTFAPGNFAKLLTAAVVFDALDKGEITEDTLYEVSEHAWRTGGAPARVTTMFAAVRSEIAVRDLLKGLIVHYGNDAAIILAEGIAGSETAFAQRMNAFAETLGMDASRFVNPTGYADPRARISLDDLRTLVDHLQREHPERYRLYGLEEFEWNRILQRNKTRYVNELDGVDGLMLAFDEADGFGAVVSAVRNGRRVLVAASGFATEADRDTEIRSLLDAAYQGFAPFRLYPEGAVVGMVRTFGGEETRVPVTGKGALAVTMPVGDRSAFRARIVYDGPVAAPIEKGQQVASLEIREGDRVYQRVPLYAAVPVPVGPLGAQARDGLAELLLGWW